MLKKLPKVKQIKQIKLIHSNLNSLLFRLNYLLVQNDVLISVLFSNVLFNLCIFSLHMVCFS